MFNLVARAHAEGPDSDAWKMHAIRRQDFMWIGEEGMMMCGTNGSQLWDTGFIAQALVETGLAELEENKAGLIRALEWFDESQMREDPMHFEVLYRHSTKGAWGFRYVHGIPKQTMRLTGLIARRNRVTLLVTVRVKVSKRSCTFKISFRKVFVLSRTCRFEMIFQSYTPKLVDERRMCDAVDVMLSLQNPNGGFASYELIRGPEWLELLNPAEVFGKLSAVV